MKTQNTLVSSFLGSGKTATLLHLLSQKLSREKLGILVNECGESSVDAVPCSLTVARRPTASQS